jgi:hypothetical protein
MNLSKLYPESDSAQAIAKLLSPRTERIGNVINDDDHVQERDKIVFGKSLSQKDYGGGIKHFAGLTHQRCQSLINHNHTDPEDRQNDAPSFAQITDFLQRNPSFTAHGYVVSPEREDYRVTLEGVESDDDSDIDEFCRMFHDADEFEVSLPRAWYD